MASFGEGLGGVIGGALGAQDLQAGLNNVNGMGSDFNTTVAPYNQFGQSFLPGAAAGIEGVSDAASKTLGYDDFMKNYTNTPAVEYQRELAADTQNNTAAARGGLLSGSNLRSLKTIDTGIIQQGANTAYDQYLKGNNQQFGQLETALGNMFKAIGVGQTATGQQAGVTTAQMGANASLAAAQAKNDQGKGSGLGSMFGGLGSLAAMF